MKQQCQRNPRSYAHENAKANGVQVRNATFDDADAIAEIYNQGIEDHTATYETEPRSGEEQRAWLQAIAGRYPAVVAQIGGEIVGWAGAGPYQSRECYRGIGEFSMYVRRDRRGQGVGDLLVAALIIEAERLGYGNCCRAFFHSIRPAALFAANTAFVKSVSMRNMRASMAAGSMWSSWKGSFSAIFTVALNNTLRFPPRAEQCSRRPRSYRH